MNATLTVNHAYRDRKSGGYYNYNDHAYHNEPAQPAGYPVSFADAYPEPAKALEQTGVNSFLDFKLSDSAKLEVQGGFQHSFTQSVFAKETTPLLSLPSSTGYGDVRLKVADLDVHASYSAGTQEGLGHSIYDFTNTVYAPGTGPLPALPAPYITGAVNYAGPPVFDYVLRPRTLDTAASYELKWGHWAAKPEVAFRNASDNSLIFGGSRDLTDFGAAVKLEYALSDWRLVGAVRGDRYNTQNKYYGSWELAATRKLGESQLLRAVWSRANKFPTFLDAFANARFRVAINNPAASSAYGSPVSFVGNARTSGDTGLDLQTEDLYELGHRAKFGKFMFDTELFDSHTSNIAGTTNPTTQQLQAGVPIQIVARGGARQIGIDQSVAFNQSPSWQHRIYYTLQNTARTEGGVTVNHPGTPMLYGGFVENFRPTDRWNINLNPYYYTASAIRMRFMPAADPDEIQPAKLIVNLDVSYEVRTGIRVFADARNLFNNQNREFAFTDLAGGLYLLGFNVDL